MYVLFCFISARKKAPENSRWPIEDKNLLKKGNYTIFRCSKILEEAGRQEILQEMFRKF